MRFLVRVRRGCKASEATTERALRIESGELVAIFTQSQITARASLAAKSPAVVILVAVLAYLTL